MSRSAIESILSQHAEEAAFLWLLRDTAVRAPHYSLADLAKLDNRLEANLDGMRIAGDSGWEVVQHELRWDEPGEVFAAAVLAFEADAMDRIHPVLDAARKIPDLARASVSALGWLPYEKTALRVGQLAASQTPDLRYIGIAAACAHRRDPGRALAESLSADDARLRARALRGVGELARADLVPLVRRHFDDPDIACRTNAAWSAALLGDRTAIEVLRSLTTVDNPLRLRAMDLALRRLDPAAAIAWQEKLAGAEGLLRLAVIAAGVIGDPRLVPWLIGQMATPELARVAGEAFTFITGADLAYADLEGEPPGDFEAGPTDNPADENVALDPDENLPWPDPARVQGWWGANGNRFAIGTRHLLGEPINADSLNQALRTGCQRHRAAAALEIALRQTASGKPLWSVQAPGFRQQQLLSV